MTIIIRPARRWRMLDVKELWDYRELAYALMMRDIKVRYRQTLIGIAWAVIKPVTTMLVFTLVFGKIVNVSSDGFPYPVFVFAALLPWQFFSNSLASAANSVQAQKTLITRVYFPRLIIPIASVGAGVLDMLICMLVLIVLMAIYGIAPTPNLVMVPVLLLMVVLVALGVGVLVAGLSVGLRDFIHLLPFAIQLWLFLTPVVYSVRSVPDSVAWMIAINPMTGLVEAFRAAFLGTAFDAGAIAVSGVSALVLFIVGVMVFERVEQGFADVI